ncbi:MAG TPA: protein kinase, partial [Vicinamibacterales bacterium]|nr:protein kinase [Vicinamibacterales bacterium]
MSIATGTRLDTYQILARLGAGGMGEVYRAHDSKLNRDVALKILSEAFAGDANRLARFEREAKALAALNHPNIAHVYDSGTSAGTSYLVMELVDGDDLSALIARGPQPVAEAVRIAGQIVNALEAAHDAGIVHRDLKPANIRVRPDGTVKVLDFGLAKALQPFGQSGNLADSPTITLPAATVPGVILGTAAYMSPEQARGKPVDRRTDIWAFGAVFYEMLTGRRAFGGEDVTEVLGAVMRGEPDWQALPPEVPPAIRALIQGCLQKDRAQRVADISTARFIIGAASSLADVRPAAPSPARRWSPALAAGAVLVALLGGASLWLSGRAVPVAIARYTVTPGEGQEMAQAAGVNVALSPDGAWMVYVGSTPGRGTRLLRRHLDDLDAIALPGSDGATAPALSPDGRSVAFLVDGAIRTLPVEGGTPFTVVSAGGAPAWSDDGMIYYGRGNVTYRVSAQGGEPSAFTTPAPNLLQRQIDTLPGGRGLLLTLIEGTPARARIAVVGPQGGPARVILAGTQARYAATGHIVYATANGTLLAAPFDVGRLEVTGPKVAVAQGVAVESDATTHFAVSRSGSLVYATGAGFVSELVWVTRSGMATPVDPSWTGE